MTAESNFTTSGSATPSKKSNDSAHSKESLPLLRKPLSLSTLAMPTLSNMRPSESLVNALASLLAQLPQEHHDIMFTVTELIRATAKHSGQTKMPLSNLLLVFCPSLNMSPQLLRVLCENEEIWDRAEEGRMLDTERANEVSKTTSRSSGRSQDSELTCWNEASEEETPAPEISRRPAQLSIVREADTVYLDAEECPCCELRVKPSFESCSMNRSSDTRSDDESSTSISDVRSVASPTSASTFTSTDATSVSLSADPANSCDEGPQLQWSPASPLIDEVSSPASVMVGTPSTVTQRKSVPMLKIPVVTFPSDGPTTGQSHRAKKRKPTLHLFSKRSASSCGASPVSPTGFPPSPHSRSETSAS